MIWLRNLTLSRILLILACIALVLGVITYFKIFYGGGTYVVNSPLPTGSLSLGSPTSTASSSAFSDASSTASSTDSSSTQSGTLASYSSTYSTPPISWKEGYDTISLTGASLSGSQLTLTLDVHMGALAECVPMNLRVILNENGDLQAPITQSFNFGPNSNCVGTPDADYPGQQAIFTINPSALPLTITTGGTTNRYFELATTPDGGISITPPATSG